jgi:putative redox protein
MTLELEWQGELRFGGKGDGATMSLDAAKQAGPTPMHALAFGLAGCMAIDVVNILTRARQVPEGLRARLSAERAGQSPKRFTAFDLHFTVEGEVPPDRVERAIGLSRDTYCSVWHSLRQDIEFRTSFEVVASA